MEIRQRSPRKCCKGCGGLKPLTSFYGPYGKTETAKGSLTPRCKPCHVAYIDVKRKARKERLRVLLALETVQKAQATGFLCETIIETEEEAPPQLHIRLT